MEIKIYCITCDMKKLGFVNSEVGDKMNEKNFPILKGHFEHEIKYFHIPH